MAEPARQLPDEDKPQVGPDLHTLEGGGQTTPRKTGHLKSVDADSLAASEKSGGGNDTVGKGYTDQDSSASENSSESGTEKLGKGFPAQGKAGGRFNNLLGRARRHKRAIFGTTGIAGLVFGGVFGFSILSGPMQLVHLSQILQRNNSISNESSHIRLNRLFRYARTGNYGETRVGIIGSKYFGKIINQLNDAGIEFQRNSLGHVKSATFDTGKLEKKFPELKGMDEAGRKAFLADKFNLSPDQFTKVSGLNGGKFAVNTRDFGVTASRALTDNSVALLGDGKIATAVKTHVLAKVFDEPTLFHPLKKARAAVDKKYATKLERQQAEKERQKKAQEAARRRAAPAEKGLKDKLSGKRIVGSALVLTSGMCLIRDVADDVVAVNNASIVVPTVLQATDKEAVGAQVQSNIDVDMAEAGGVEEGFTNDQGKTIWQGRALQATAGMKLSGTDLPVDYQQAFSNDTTAAHIKKYAGGFVGSIACSKLGQAAQVGISLGLLASSFFDGGGSLAAFAAIKGAEAAATAGAMQFIEHLAVKLLAAKVIVPEVLSGPLGGNLLAYGARAASNIAARSSGGIALTAAQAATLEKPQLEQSNQAWQSKSFFARMFDTSDYRSLTGHLADSMSPDWTQNFGRMFSSIASIGNILPSLLHLTPAAGAADTYQWPFPQYGIPMNILTASDTDDPYDNADKVAKILNNDSGYIDKAEKCFGVDISKSSGVWDVTPADAVDPNSSDYTDAGCADTSDPDWRRVMLFVFDTNTMKSAACYMGDQQSCNDLGISQDDTTSGAGVDGFTIASINAQDGEAHMPQANAICRAAGAGVTGQACLQFKSDELANLIQGIKGANNKQLDVVGLQEMNQSQFHYLKQALQGTGYSIYPTTFSHTNGGQRPIVYNTSKFQLSDGGALKYPWYSSPGYLSWVKLQSTSGGSIYMYNIHPVSSTYPKNTTVMGVTNYAKKRELTAKIIMQDIKSRVTDGSPVFITGDMNSTFSLRKNRDWGITRNELPYCIFTADGSISDAFDLFHNKGGQHCPSSGGSIDHIFASTSETVSDFRYVKGGLVPKTTDHASFPMATIAASGTDSAASGQSGQDFIGPDGLSHGWCTDYIKHVLARHSSNYHGGSLGDGKDVANNLGKLGYQVNHTPSVHAVVSFPGPPYGHVKGRYAGHVALVGQVNADGSIVVEEFNFYNKMRYGRHNVSASAAKSLTYAHTEQGWH